METELLLEELARIDEDKNISFELYNKLPWKEVQSSHIKKIAFDVKNQKLYVEFINQIRNQNNETIVYQYSNVNAKEYKALVNAESKGKHMHQFIKNKKPYVRLWVSTRPDKYKKVHIFIRK
ncbi:MAG: KTSC domain-containing protein [Patescibacteria group bacterium]|nr:KTSC domain-containing protein [Patescibacteria group bacterium]